MLLFGDSITEGEQKKYGGCLYNIFEPKEVIEANEVLSSLTELPCRVRTAPTLFLKVSTRSAATQTQHVMAVISARMPPPKHGEPLSLLPLVQSIRRWGSGAWCGDLVW
jgi:hypothetical protein